MPLGELIDTAKQRERLLKEKENLLGEIKRANGKLSNEKFVSKAPEAVVNEERNKLNKYTEMLNKVENRIESLKEL